MSETQTLGHVVEILLVEDNPDDVFLLKKSLLRGKITNTLHVAEDGFEALDFLYRRGKFQDVPRPDLILLDLNLPGKDGREVLAEIKRTKGLKEIPVVILTTSESEKDILNAYENYANSYVTKPVDFNKFVELTKSITEYWFTLVKLPPKKE